jgi:hypothetical protein
MVQGKRATSERELSGEEKKTPIAKVWISLFLFSGFFILHIRAQSVCLARSHKLTYIGLYLSLSLFLRARPLLNNDQTRIARRVRKTYHSQFRYKISGMPRSFFGSFFIRPTDWAIKPIPFHMYMRVRSRESNGQSIASRTHRHERNTSWMVSGIGLTFGHLISSGVQRSDRA